MRLRRFRRRKRMREFVLAFKPLVERDLLEAEAVIRLQRGPCFRILLDVLHSGLFPFFVSACILGFSGFSANRFPDFFSEERRCPGPVDCRLYAAFTPLFPFIDKFFQYADGQFSIQAYSPNQQSPISGLQKLPSTKRQPLALRSEM